MNKQQLQQFVQAQWDDSIIPTLIDYIKIPNKSPDYDPQWVEHGYMEQAVAMFCQWCNDRPLPGMKLEVVRLAGRTPVIYIDIPGTQDGTVLLYGHLDKQPEMTGWHEGLGPWQPVIKDDRLYGRGGADDGYALFAAYSAIMAVQAQKLAHPRCVILIEACEESGSVDLPFYIEHLKDRLGVPKLVICLDSGCGNYDQLWCTTSLRGVMCGNLSIEVLTAGIHSGTAGGIVPSTTLVLRQLLSRLEDEKTGRILPPELSVAVPEQRVQQAKQTAAILAEKIYTDLPFQTGVQPISKDLSELLLNQNWRAALAVTGIEGLPPLANAGNVALPNLTVKLSFRSPPTADVKVAIAAIKKLLETDPPFGAKVSFEPSASADGWHAPLLDTKLAQSMEKASQDYFGKEPAFMGEGGSIPFMGMLGKKFPAAQFLITGVLGPQSNAHGPNEFLHLPTAKKLTCCVAQILTEV